MSSYQRTSANQLVEGASLDATRTALLGVAPGDAEMEHHRGTISTFIDDHEDALWRTCLSGHLTGSAIIVDHTRERMVVLFHTKLQRWLQPGGHADGEGNIAAVAMREAQEETGLAGLEVVEPAVDIDVHEIPARGDEPQHLHLDLRYLLLAPEGATLVGNHESRELRWVTMHELLQLDVDAGLLRMARRAFEVAAQLNE